MNHNLLDYIYQSKSFNKLEIRDFIDHHLFKIINSFNDDDELNELLDIIQEPYTHSMILQIVENAVDDFDISLRTQFIEIMINRGFIKANTIINETPIIFHFLYVQRGITDDVMKIFDMLVNIGCLREYELYTGQRLSECVQLEHVFAYYDKYSSRDPDIIDFKTILQNIETSSCTIE